MRVLVTGGSGVIGEGLIPVLVGAGHTVRLLTRGAEKDAAEWPEGVEPFAADVSEPKSLKGAAEGCEAAVHITGIVNEAPPEVTFERVNVSGTKNILEEAERAGVSRFIYVSSLGADRGRSRYHESKRRAEESVKNFKGDWLILRPGAVYGPGDEVLSTLLKLIRVLPAMPVIDDGNQRFQPVWFEDAGKAIAKAVETKEVSAQTLELAGGEMTDMNDVIDRLSRITGRTPARIPVPSFIASLGAKLFEGNSLGEEIKKLTGLDAPVDEAKLSMLLEENFIKQPQRNALTDVFGIKPLPLDKGLKALADLLPEQSVTDGVGEIERKRFHADIERSRYNASQMLEEFRARCVELMPLEFVAEPGAASLVEKGATLTASIPLRGNIQVRVEEVTARRITFVTLEGHPLAGIVQFKTSPLKPNRVRFMIEIHARHASLFDRITMAMGGSIAQNMNWQQVVERVVEMSGGRAPEGVKSEDVTLDEEESREAERKIEGLMKRFKREVKAERSGVEEETKRSKSAARETRAARKSSARDAKANEEAQVAVGDSIKGAVESVSGAASALVESMSAAASRLTGSSGKRRAKKAGR